MVQQSIGNLNTPPQCKHCQMMLRSRRLLGVGNYGKVVSSNGHNHEVVSLDMVE